MGQIFESVTLKPRFFNNRPKDAAVIPFPKEETTPPVTKIYLVAMMPPTYYIFPERKYLKYPSLDEVQGQSL